MTNTRSFVAIPDEVVSEDFMFEMTKQEFEYWRYQFGTSNTSDKMGLRYTPYVTGEIMKNKLRHQTSEFPYFTEHSTNLNIHRHKLFRVS